MFINKGEMKADEYIKKTREYLDYIEDHIENVRKAFGELSEKCQGMFWVSDDYQWHSLRDDVMRHDLSKLSQYEFIQYRNSFYPVNDSDKKNSIDEAWNHHKENNTHHHETVRNFSDVIHMVIDWTAMGYKFGNTAQEYYEANKGKINLSDIHKNFIYEIFEKLKTE